MRLFAVELSRAFIFFSRCRGICLQPGVADFPRPHTYIPFPFLRRFPSNIVRFLVVRFDENRSLVRFTCRLCGRGEMNDRVNQEWEESNRVVCNAPISYGRVLHTGWVLYNRKVGGLIQFYARTKRRLLHVHLIKALLYMVV